MRFNCHYLIPTLKLHICSFFFLFATFSQAVHLEYYGQLHKNNYILKKVHIEKKQTRLIMVAQVIFCRQRDLTRLEKRTVCDNKARTIGLTDLFSRKCQTDTLFMLPDACEY